MVVWPHSGAAGLEAGTLRKGRSTLVGQLLSSALLPPPSLSLLAPLPGPFSLPGLGSPSFLYRYSICNEPLGPLLLTYRREYGDIFSIATGPIRQVWVADDAMADELYSMDACAGRSQLPDGQTPFGKGFLFLTREPADAQPIRREQTKTLSATAGTRQAQAAVDAIQSELYAAIDLAVAQGAARNLPGAAWPVSESIAALGTPILGALLTLFVGGESDDAECLTFEERGSLLGALAGYR